MTPEQYNEAKAILKNAPDGATHYGDGDEEIRPGYAKIEGGVHHEVIHGEWEPVWPEYQDVSATRSLSDIRQLCEFYERDRWIPVSERLPEVDKVVMAYDEETVWFGYHYASYDGECWHTPDNYGLQITHWKPLPAPPEEEDNE